METSMEESFWLVSPCSAGGTLGVYALVKAVSMPQIKFKD